MITIIVAYQSEHWESKQFNLPRLFESVPLMTSTLHFWLGRRYDCFFTLIFHCLTLLLKPRNLIDDTSLLIFPCLFFIGDTYNTTPWTFFTRLTHIMLEMSTSSFSCLLSTLDPTALSLGSLCSDPTKWYISSYQHTMLHTLHPHTQCTRTRCCGTRRHVHTYT